MKQPFTRVLTASILAFAAILLLQSCKKSSDSGSSSNSSGFYISATVNNQPWAANVNSTLNNSPAIAAVTNSGSTSIMLLLGIKAAGKDTSVMVLIFPQNVTLNKTLTLDPVQYLEGAYLTEIAPGSGTYYTYNTTSAVGGSGTLTISSFDQSTKIIEGSFAGTFGSQQGRPAVVITEGKFRCPYTTDVNQLPKTGAKF